MSAQRSQTAAGRASAQTKAESPHASPEARSQGWPGATAGTRELEKLIAARATPRLWCNNGTMEEVFFKVDPTDDTPIHACTVQQDRVKVIARFRRLGDAALAYGGKDTNTLPAEIVRQVDALIEKGFVP